MKPVAILKQIEQHSPPILIGFAAYSGFKFILEAFRVINVSLNPFDTISILSVGFLFMFEKHIPLNHLFAFAPALISFSFCHDFFGVMLGIDGFTGNVVMGISALIGFCIYFIHFAMAKVPEQSAESPKDQKGKYPLFLDAEDK